MVCYDNSLLSQELVYDKPVKLKPISAFYLGKKSSFDTDGECSTDSEEKRKRVTQDFSDSEVGASDRKKLKMASGERVAFKTLAQLLDPRRDGRVKSYPPKKKPGTVFPRVRKIYDKCSKIKRYSTSARRKTMSDGCINLVVDLVFEKDVGSSSCSDSGLLLPFKDRSRPVEVTKLVEETKLESHSTSATTSGELSVAQNSGLMLERQKIASVTDPTGLLLNPVKEAAKSISHLLPFKKMDLKWREIDVGDVEPTALVNRICKVYRPLQNKWDRGRVIIYNEQTRKHQVVYDNNMQEFLVLQKERLALYVSLHEKISLVLGFGVNSSGAEISRVSEELLVLAASTEGLDGSFYPGEVVWAGVEGYPLWPALVTDEEHARSCPMEINHQTNTLRVQFFGSHDCARVDLARVTVFSKGLLNEYQSKCRRISFERAIHEAERYLKDQKLPDQMLYSQEESFGGQPHKQSEDEIDEDFVGDERKHVIKKSMESLFRCPIKLGFLRVLSLGKIVTDSEYFHDQNYIWTEGYTAIRKFFSVKDPSKRVNYKMEVLKNPLTRTMPLFRVTPEDADQVEGASAAACWKKIFQRLQRARQKLAPHVIHKNPYRSGAVMYGFAHPQVSRLIQALPYARVCCKFKSWAEATPSEESEHLLPAGFKRVDVKWMHLDRCSACYTNEEYEGNALLQCDKCRMLVHLNCYGVLEKPGDLWLCNLCNSDAPKQCPPCCLCPITGGAMKRTTSGRWVHIACALWIPETCCIDMDRLEPIDGIQSINKERWKLTCAICEVPYGACIQCADSHCRVAYHPLCARAAGLYTTVLEGLRRKRNRITGVYEELSSVQLLSYCRKHTQNGFPKSRQSLDGPQPYSLRNASGCARSEPYNVSVRRGRREPIAKRGFLESRPYIVSGCLRSPLKRVKTFTNEDPKLVRAIRQNMREFSNGVNLDNHQTILSTSERFSQMKTTLHKRLTFGKSSIHGWGLFAKQAHDAGDMVIEYAGEIVRPGVADVRERSCYNSLVGAGTYMFCFDNERVIDATRAGSIAHLINHSCEPNCYSRVVAACGKERIIIFAKQEIGAGQEITYDYRFASIGDQLPCHCGSSGCRGIVNAEDDDSGRMLVRSSELTKWTS